jgi:hypothetical protein
MDWPDRARPAGFTPCIARALRSVALAGLALTSCATFDEDVHLAPFFSNLSTAGGGREIEAVAGMIRVRRPTPSSPVNEWAVRPFISEKLEPNGDALLRFIVPLGTRRIVGQEYTLQLLPVARYQRDIDIHGHPQWKLLMLPGILWSQDDSGRIVRAFFPFGGVIENFLTFDRITFALFPLFLKTERQGQTSTSFLWPIFNFTSRPKGDATGGGWRVWPIYGRQTREGQYDRRFYLWPFFHYQRNHLSSNTPEKRWMFFPLIGHTSRGDYRADSVLWPFFGYARNPQTGFWAWDGPWPLVRILRPGRDKPDDPYRTRFWPVYSYYKGDGLESTWALWPLINVRTEVYRDAVRRGEYIFPFWRHWVRTSDEGIVTSWSKLWPLFQNSREGELERFAFPALNPLWNLPVIDDHYAWIYELITRESLGPQIKERTWGGLWRREADENEDRASLAGLWARRQYQREGEEVVETSILFGLVRWRTWSSGSSLMWPAVPGPGWPAERARRVTPAGEGQP